MPICSFDSFKKKIEEDNNLIRDITDIFKFIGQIREEYFDPDADKTLNGEWNRFAEMADKAGKEASDGETQQAFLNEFSSFGEFLNTVEEPYDKTNFQRTFKAIGEADYGRKKQEQFLQYMERLNGALELGLDMPALRESVKDLYDQRIEVDVELLKKKIYVDTGEDLIQAYEALDRIDRSEKKLLINPADYLLTDEETEEKIQISEVSEDIGPKIQPAPKRQTVPKLQKVPKKPDGFYWDVVREDNMNLRKMMKGIRGRLLTLAGSEEYSEALGDASEDAEKLSRYASEIHTAFGIRAPGKMPLEMVKKLSQKDILHGLRQSEKIGDFLLKQDPYGNYYRATALKDAAKKLNGSAETLYEDMYYMNDKLKLGLPLREMFPESVFEKKKMRGQPSWANYRDDHLRNVPFDKKEREACLARAMVGAFKAHQQEHTDIHDSFSVKKARGYAEKLMKAPLFKKLCEDQAAVNDLIHAARKHPENLHKIATQILWPFSIVETQPKKRTIALEERREMLTRLKNMADLMDGDKSGNSKWNALRKSICTIDLKTPGATGEEKLNEIYLATENYLKDALTKSKNLAAHNRTHQALDILAELSKAGTFAKMKAQMLFDKVKDAASTLAAEKMEPLKNSIEEGKTLLQRPQGNLHSPKDMERYREKTLKIAYKNADDEGVLQVLKSYAQGLKLKDFGAHRLPNHANNKKQPAIKAYMQKLQTSKEFEDPRPFVKMKKKKPGQEQEVKEIVEPKEGPVTVFDPYPRNDPSRLPRIPKDRYDNSFEVISRYKNCFEDVKMVNSFVKDDLGDGKAITQLDAEKAIAAALALSKTKLYYCPSRRTGESQVKLDKDEYQEHWDRYVDDPVVKKLAERYTAPGSRRELLNNSNAKNVKMFLDIDLLKKRYNEVQMGAVKQEKKPEGPAMRH